MKENLATIIVAAILIALVVAVVVKLIRDRRHGKSSCAFCPDSANCSLKQKGACKKVKNDVNLS